MSEKRQKLFQIFDVFGENLSEGNQILKEREKKIWDNFERRYRELHQWLKERGMIRDKTERSKKI